MHMTVKDHRFLDKRRTLIRAWRYAGPALVACLLALLVFLLVRTPLLINPFVVAEQLESGTLDESSLTVMAAILPVLFWAVLFMLAIIVVFLYVVMAREKRYLEMIDVLSAVNDGKLHDGAGD